MPRKGMQSVFFKPSSPWRHSTSPRTPCHSFSQSLIEDRIAAAEILISRWNADSSDFSRSTSLFHLHRHEAAIFLKAVRDLHSAMRIFIKENPSSPTLLHAQSLMKTAMKRLEWEFYQILSMNRDALDPESVSMRFSRVSTISSSSEFDVDTSEDEFREVVESSITSLDQAASRAMGDAREIADCMIGLGYGNECVKVYKTIRKSIVDEGLYRLGVEGLANFKAKKVDWQVVEIKIATWLRAVRIAVKVLFSGERILCDNIFSCSESIRESCFSDITKDGALMLLGFPEFVASVKKTPEKVFRTLDLYEAVADLGPEIESIFSSKATEGIRNQLVTLVAKLGASVRLMLEDLESLIQKDTSRSVMRGARVHPITSYVINYLSFLTDYTGVLTDISINWPLTMQSTFPSSYLGMFTVDDGPAHSIAVRVAWIVLVLLCKLDEKSKFYRDAGLSFVFLANNLQYVVNKVGSSKLRILLGSAWLEKHQRRVKEYASAYELAVWSKVLSVLPDISSASMSPQEAKRKFVDFNREFEEAHDKQASWTVQDLRLRKLMRESIERKIIPPYKEFYEKSRQGVRETRAKIVVVKFSPDDLHNYLANLFHHDGEDKVSSQLL